jgi:hypothetical protein
MTLRHSSAKSKRADGLDSGVTSVHVAVAADAGAAPSTSVTARASSAAAAIAASCSWLMASAGLRSPG